MMGMKCEMMDAVMNADKADMDVESFSDGILGSIVIQEGETAGVGNPIAFIAESEADLAEAKSRGSGGGWCSAMMCCYGYILCDVEMMDGACDACRKWSLCRCPSC